MKKQRRVDRSKEEEGSRRNEKSGSSKSCCADLDSFPTARAHDKKENSLEETGMGSNKMIFAFAAFILVIMAFNQMQLFKISSVSTGNEVSNGVALVAADVAPKGVPNIYGKELGISYDDVSSNNPQKADRTIAVLKSYDEGITLSGKNLERYIAITSQISCEYCCGAASIIFSKQDEERIEQQIQAAIASGKITSDQTGQYRRKAGEAACGCAHSFAMRGLAKYLLTQHDAEFTNEQILEELAKWKTLFFPGPMATKAAVMKEKGIPFTYGSLGSNEYRGIEKEVAASGSSGGMVGGC